jgi:hypothetical protein
MTINILCLNTKMRSIKVWLSVERGNPSKWHTLLRDVKSSITDSGSARLRIQLQFPQGILLYLINRNQEVFCLCVTSMNVETALTLTVTTRFVNSVTIDTLNNGIFFIIIWPSRGQFRRCVITSASKINEHVADGFDHQ